MRKGRDCSGGDGTGWSWGRGAVGGRGERVGLEREGLGTDEFCNMKEREGPGPTWGSASLTGWTAALSLRRGTQRNVCFEETA